MKPRINYIWVLLIILATAQVAFFFASSWAKKPPERTHPRGLHKEHAQPSSVAVTVTIVGQDDPPPLPDGFSLSQNYPNPFNVSTIINYTLPEAVWVRLEVYNILGKKVATLIDEIQQPGYYSHVWNAIDRPTGVCFYRLTAGQFEQTQKMLLLK